MLLWRLSTWAGRAQTGCVNVSSLGVCDERRGTENELIRRNRRLISARAIHSLEELERGARLLSAPAAHTEKSMCAAAALVDVMFVNGTFSALH